MDPIPPRPVPRSPLRLPPLDEAARAEALATFESWRTTHANMSPEEARARVLFSGVQVETLFGCLPPDEADRAFWELIERPAGRLHPPSEATLRVLFARFGERLLPYAEGWAGAGMSELFAVMGSRDARRTMVYRFDSAHVGEQARAWADANVEAAAEAAAELAGRPSSLALAVRAWLASRFPAIAPAVLRVALAAGDPHDESVFPGGSPAVTLRWLAGRFGREVLDAACPEGDRDRLDALLDPDRALRFDDATFRIAKWWPALVKGADRAVLESPLLPQHPAAIAMREALGPDAARAMAHAIVDAFVADKAKPMYRGAIAAALRLAPDAMVARLARLAWGFVRSKNRNHRNNVIWAIAFLRDVASAEAIARLAMLAEGLSEPNRRRDAELALAWIAAERGVSREELASAALPDLELSAGGSITLDYGPRRFVVRFTAEGPRVFDEDGAPRKALPKPGKNDDPELAAAAYRRFEETRDDVRHVLDAEARRLEHAMRTERRWPIEALRDGAAHPLRRLALEGLVFGHDGGTFRLAEDREPRDARDEPVHVSGEVWIAHPIELHAGERADWAATLADYALAPPFPQLGRPIFAAAIEGGVVTTCGSWTVPLGALVGLMRRGWMGRWAMETMLAGLTHAWPGGEAEVVFRPFSPRDPAGPALPIRLAIRGQPPSRVLLSELVLDIDRIRSKRA